MMGIGGPTFSYVTAVYLMITTIAFVLDLKGLGGSITLSTFADLLQLLIVLSQSSWQLIPAPVCPDKSWSRKWTYFSSSVGLSHTALYTVGYGIPPMHPSPDMALPAWGTINLVITIYMFFADMWGYATQMECTIRRRAVSRLGQRQRV
jgi:hypothetical protein